jgi:SOS-response transcriptional repressor LexA
MTAPVALPLTESQLKVFDFVAEFIRDRRRPPTLQEIATGLGHKSRSKVHETLVKLRAVGLVDWENNRKATLRIVDRASEVVAIPSGLRSRVAAHCAVTGESVDAFIVDAVTLHLDHAEAHADDIREAC